MNRLLPLLSLALFACNEPMEEVSTAGTNAFAAYENARGTRVESFYFGGNASNAVVDYVFVLDNSVSMVKILERVRAGFDSLDPDQWPADARIAVLGTLVHDLDDPERLHPTIERMRPRAIHDPGFTQFVSSASIAAHNQAVPELAKRFTARGCDEWFAPGERGPDGKSCIQAHTQIALDAVGVEAGLTALKQLLEANQGTALFRPGASVNIVFVSDTHDPGSLSDDSQDLLERRPTAQQLIRLIERDNDPSAIRFHAIAPESNCVERWTPLGPAYFDVAAATGGQKLDACKATDYRPILDAVLTTGARPTKPVFALGADAEQILEVTVDGVATPFMVNDHGVVQVDIAPQPGSEASVVEITYDKAPKATPRAVNRTRRQRR